MREEGSQVQAPKARRAWIAKYVLKQEDHHRKQAFEEEYIELLKWSGVEYDERYLW